MAKRRYSMTGEATDDGVLDSIAQRPVDVPPDLAARYVEAARFVASVPEDEAVAMFVPAEDDPRLDELRRFLSFIFIGWRTRAPFYFFPKMREEVRRLHRHRHLDGAFPEFLFGRPTSDGGRTGRWLMPLRFFCDYTSCGQGKRGDFPALRRQMGKLLLLNALGWDVYGCPNPILYGCRIQRAVPWITNLVAESDDATLDEQEESARRMAGIVGAVVFSGRRSLHQYFRLAAPIRNPHVVTTELLDGLMPPGARTGNRPWTKWNLVMALKRAGRLAPVPVEPFRHVADLLRCLMLERSGIRLCPATLFNFCCLARVPGFAHAGTGERARLLSVDLSACWHDNSLGEPDDVRHSPFWRRKLGIPAEEVFPARHGKRPSSPLPHGALDDADQEGRGGTEEAIQPHRQDSSVPVTAPKGGELPLPTDNKRVTLPRQAGRTFLDDLSDFEHLKAHGIQCRGTRRSLHKVMANVALLHGWTKSEGRTILLDRDRIRDEWRTILLLSGNSIGCSVEYGLAEIDGFVQAKNRCRSDGHFSFAMPDCTKLPDMGPQRRKSLREGIQRLVADEIGRLPALPSAIRGATTSTVTGITNIVADVIYPRMRTHAGQCAGGTLALPAKKMQAKCPRARFAPVREWMYRLNMISPTRRACHAAGLTRLYWVNVPLILWLMGFAKAELAWERHDSPRAAGDARPCPTP